MSKSKVKLKTGDKVKVISGEHRGTIDYISHLDLKEQVVYLKKVNRKVYDKSTPDRKKKKEKKEIMIPIHISNIAYYLEAKKSPTKIGYQEIKVKKANQTHLKKVRVARGYQ